MNILKAIIFFITTSIFAQVDKVEPPFWYSGMHNPELQIMFYGKNIAQNEVSVSNTIIIKDIKKTENPNYIFVTIDTKNVPVQEFVFSFSKNKKIAFTSKYSLKQRKENSAQRKSFDASDMMYLLMPDRFANGNPKNDSDKSTPNVLGLTRSIALRHRSKRPSHSHELIVVNINCIPGRMRLDS